MKIKRLVVDTAAFVKNVPLWEYGEEFFTVQEVISEIKDKQTKYHISSLPVELQIQNPSATAIKFIIEFTRKTGDYASLSIADIKILALTYDLEVQAKGSNEHLRLEPLVCRTEIKACKPNPEVSKPNSIEGFYLSQANREGSAAVSSLQSETDGDVITSSIVHETEYNYVAESELLHTLNVHPESDDLDNITYDLLTILNIHLSNFSYIGGYFLSYGDFVIKEALHKSFPLMHKVSVISAQMCAAGETTFISKLFKLLLNELAFEEQIIVKSEHEECKSYRNFKSFIQQFSSLPHFIRWFFHMQTLYADNISMNLPADDTSLNSILNNLRKNVEDNENNETSVHSIEDCMNSLELKCVELHSTEAVATRAFQEQRERETECNVQDLLDPPDVDEGFEQVSGEEDSSSSSLEQVTDSEVDNDDDDGWITPSNLKFIKKNISDEIIEVEMNTACITADYAMQNTLKHIGLRVMGVDGKLIHNLRTFILRCYACFKTTTDMDLLFCKHCGNNTLKRVSVTLNPDGTQKIWISTRKPINIRGTKFSLPMPKGGKYAINPILVADQREAQQRASKLAKIRNDPLHENYGTGLSPFITRDIYSRSAILGFTSGKKQHRGLLYWEQRNPNVPMKRKSHRKK